MSLDARSIRERLAQYSVSLVADVLKEHGSDRLVMRGIVRRTPAGAAPLVGQARTLRFVPARCDFKAPAGNLRMRLIDDVRSGEVLVFDASCNPASSAFGDMVAARAATAGATGIVIDGALRDVDAIAALGLSAYSSNIAPAPNAAPSVPQEADAPIQCGGVLVLPGDWIVADGDGVIVIPASLAADVVEKGDALTRKEEFCRGLIERGHTLAEAFPMPAGLAPHFATYLETGRLPTADEVRGTVR
ncbi:4-hydroxy-4-methyl-2-oxoglutarate aldolase [Pigmentiphaga humi]|uniref:4-hydroxy-4-methyl-2-oxoglutarate aldolase n=1 Tax=Pigmentiphaga humi TaxID=2478468 RepID=A0A3P4B605_9BURK|nr:hypothetical protein [Pigmentiphaga humi]VCU71050.1 4-hydroxy-4-methyl-2-oxoglutarate aldolase [Pigmentiphaga humi]